MTVNGAEVAADVEDRTLLVHFLRETAGLTATHIGCDTTSCGACTVLLDGESVKSCTVLAVQAQGHDYHGGRAGRAGWPAPGAAGVPQLPWPAVRVLHSGHGAGRGVPHPGGPAADRGPGALGAGGQPLPVHRLPQHRAGGPVRRRGVAGSGGPATGEPATGAPATDELATGETAHDPGAVHLPAGRVRGPGDRAARRARRRGQVAGRRPFAGPDDETAARPARDARRPGPAARADYVRDAAGRRRDRRADQAPRPGTLRAAGRAGPLLPHAASEVGDPQIRHRGTIGGSVAHGDPAADLPAVILALDAAWWPAGPAGRGRSRSTTSSGSSRPPWRPTSFWSRSGSPCRPRPAGGSRNSPACHRLGHRRRRGAGQRGRPGQHGQHPDPGGRGGKRAGRRGRTRGTRRRTRPTEPARSRTSTPPRPTASTWPRS